MQTVDLALFTSLTAGEVLFVDAFHVVKPGSDVDLLVLETPFHHDRASLARPNRTTTGPPS